MVSISKSQWRLGGCPHCKTSGNLTKVRDLPHKNVDKFVVTGAVLRCDHCHKEFEVSDWKVS